jgi:hypothetical protein
MKFYLVGYYHSLDYKKCALYSYNSYNFDAYHPKEMKQKLDYLIKDNSQSIVVISSVHSDLFNIFGHYILEGKLKPEDIDITLFDENHNKIECGYDPDGYLNNNYPYGFFNWSE